MCGKTSTRNFSPDIDLRIGTHMLQSAVKRFSFIELSNRCDYDVSPSRMFDLPRLLPHRYCVGQRISALQ